MIESQSQPPLILIASAGEWVGRSLENVLEANGFTALRVESGRRTLELARRIRPNAILLDDSLPDIGCVDVCRALRDDPLFSHATPILITAAAQHASRIRSAAYAAGAWDYCTLPLDVETLVSKLHTFIRAAVEVEAERSKTFVDRATGLYTPHGLTQWIETLGAQAVRKREPMACVVVTPDFDGEEGKGVPLQEQSTEALAAISDVCRSHSRRSDVVGLLSDSRVAIIAPDTDLAGVQRLIDRLQEALDKIEKTRPGHRAARFRAGYCAIPNLADANFAPAEIVRRAETALDYVPRGRFDSAAVNFDELLPS